MNIKDIKLAAFGDNRRTNTIYMDIEAPKEIIDKLKINNTKLEFGETFIRGADWDTLFDELCPQYNCIDGLIYKNKQEWWGFAKLYHGYGSEKIKEPNWDQINKNKTIPLEVQELASDLYLNFYYSFPRLRPLEDIEFDFDYYTN